MLHFRRASARTLTALAFCAGVAGAQEPQKHLLRFTYTKDATTWHRMATDISMQMDMMGQKVENKVALEMTMHSKVVEVLPDGSAKVEQTVKRLRTKLVNPMMGGELLYDSAAEGAEAGPMADLAVLVGVKMTLEMDSRGRVRKLRFPPDLEDKLSGQTGLEDLENMFSKESLVLPEQPVVIGEPWKAEQKLPLGGGVGEIAMNQENKLVSFENGIAVIDQKVSFGEGQELPSPLPTGGMMKVSGPPAEGRVELDLRSGRFEKTGTRMKLQMKGSGIDMAMDMQLDLQRIEEPKPESVGAGQSAPPTKKDGGGY